MDCLRNIIPKIELHPSQNKGVEMALRFHRVLLGHDTGMGKSYMYATVIRGLLNANPDGKHIIVMIHDSMSQLPQDIANLAECPVAAVDATQSSANYFSKLFATNSVICMTYEAFTVPSILLELYQCLPLVESFSLDEAHHASNWDTSDTALMIRAFAQFAKYNIGLTATPMTVSSKQFYRLMNILDRDLSSRRDETFANKYTERYLPANREDYGIKGQYKTTLIPVVPQVDQLGKQSGIVFKGLKGTGAEHQVEALVKVLQERVADGKQCIVYIAYHDSRHWVEQHLDEAGLRYTSIHGQVVSKDERAKRAALFRDRKVDILLTSISESLNLSADVVVFYEFNAKMKQVIGRAHRGLEGKNLEIVVIITQDTDEVDFFKEKVQQRAERAQTILHKDYSEILALGDEIDKMQLND